MKNMFRTIVKYLLPSIVLLVISCFQPLEAKRKADCNFNVVFVHIGEKLPGHMEIALAQARLFNPDCQIILVANEQAIRSFTPRNSKLRVTMITCESLVKKAAHERFMKETTLDGTWREGFWLYTSERFLYLDDLISQYHLKNVVHLENDVMLYENLNKLIPIFSKCYKGIAATFDNDERCIPGILYIRDEESMGLLGDCFAENASRQAHDMQVLFEFKRKYGRKCIDNLPIIPEEFVDTQPMGNLIGQVPKNKYDFCQHFKHFDSVFDAAALGQYLGGGDDRNYITKPGLINERCFLNSSLLTFKWHKDRKGRKVPYMVYGKKKWKINNLHISSKRLEQFTSKRIRYNKKAGKK